MGKILDECFRARMDVLRNRFPLREFRREFVAQFARKGTVFIQGAAIDIADAMVSDESHGLIFSCQQHIDKALRLVRRWGFEVVERRTQGNIPCYQVLLPEEYLLRQMGSLNIGQRRTQLRSQRHNDSLSRETLDEYRKALVI